MFSFQFLCQRVLRNTDYPVQAKSSQELCMNLVLPKVHSTQRCRRTQMAIFMWSFHFSCIYASNKNGFESPRKNWWNKNEIRGLLICKRLTFWFELWVILSETCTRVFESKSNSRGTARFLEVIPCQSLKRIIANFFLLIFTSSKVWLSIKMSCILRINAGISKIEKQPPLLLWRLGSVSFVQFSFLCSQILWSSPRTI